MATIHEIAPDVFRIGIYAPAYNLEFSHFVIRDDAPMLFHAGLRGMFPELHEAVGRLMDPRELRHISFSHFESDECGALNQWLELAPHADTVCGLVGALVNLNDFAIRPARALEPTEVLETGKRRFRFLPTPHVPHGWDAGVLFEESERILFCSDLFHQMGQRSPTTTDSLLEPCRDALRFMESSPLAGYIPYSAHTGRVLESLAQRDPGTLAVMHGSVYHGDGAQALRELAGVMKETLGEVEG